MQAIVFYYRGVKTGQFAMLSFPESSLSVLVRAIAMHKVNFHLIDIRRTK